MPQADPRLQELSDVYDTVQYIKKVLNENVIHGEEAYKTVGALNWLNSLGNALQVQAQSYLPQTQPQPQPSEVSKNG